ncbi:MAG TPA: M1 family aminopeptidase [Candidatus Acidoferrales bacterium]|nr:M1 family aminopeptidase [Candidatus Acidoferrales bacterium]
MRAGATGALAVLLFLPAFARARQPQQTSAVAAQSSASTSRAPQELYQSVVALRVDPAQAYSVHDLTLRRDGVAFTFAEGKFAFLQPLDGRVTGAVFLGRGRIFALPPDAPERASLARFLKTSFLDAEFDRAYLRFDESMTEEIRTQLAGQKISAETDTQFADGWNPAVAQFNPTTSLRVLEDWLSANPRSYLYGALDSPTIGSFDVLLDERRPETVLIGQPKSVNGSLIFDVWTSFTAPNIPAPADAFSPLDYTVDTQISDDLSLSGTTTIHLRALAGERVLELELSRFLRVNSVTDASGQSFTFFQNQELRRQDVARRGNDLLFIILPRLAGAGEEYDLRISYQGTVIGDAGNSVYFVGARGSWYPHLAGPDRFTPFDLTFRWPKRLTLVTTGEQLETHEEGNTRTGHWRTTAPIGIAGFNLGSYASLTVGEKPVLRLFANQQLEDAIIARLERGAANSQPSLPSTNPLRPPGGLEPDTSLPLLLPSPAGVLKRLGNELLDSIQYFEGLDGPFPFSDLNVSPIPGSFGQGWPGLLYLSTFVFLPQQAQEQAGLPERAQEQVEQLVPYHELAHQWWGNVVAPASYRDAWLEEAMANYQALLYDESRHPKQHELQNWLTRYRDSLEAKPPGSDQPMDAAGPLDFGYRLESSRTPDAYNTIVYNKGTWVIHMLRMLMRAPRTKNPDARFDELLRSVLDEHRFQTLSNAQFQKAVERRMTPAMDLEGSHSMEWFFDEWVRETGIPEYSVSFRVRPRGERLEVEGTLEQKGVSDVFAEAVPIYAVRTRGWPEYLGRVITTGPETKFRFAIGFRPIRLAIDPEHTILCRTK